ncbi:MAG: thymidylate synthase [Candidatus Omnitrophota bacterium]|jgi:thymidylate synthase ThyX|nr:MAG: thymidylate synthase [Candidatus Omnitrophota bacterium]
MNDWFSEAELETLAPFFTNTDSPVFGLKLPQEIAGALFSRYSRTAKSLRRVFLDEFWGTADPFLKQQAADLANRDDSQALQKAREFYDRVLIGYGDDSVAQLGGAHIACENISNIMAKVLEDSRIGIAFLEKSTRYVRFDKKNEQGEYAFYHEPNIMNSPHRDAYLDLMHTLFATYSKQMESMLEFIQNALPIDKLEWKHPQTGEPLPYRQIQTDEELYQWAQRAYRSTVRAHACDVLRGYLPGAALTNLGMFGVGQAYEYLLTKLDSQTLREGRSLAASIRGELNQLIPSFVKRAQRSEYLVETNQAVRSLASSITSHLSQQTTNRVTLTDYDAEGEEKVLAAILYPHTRLALDRLREVVRNLSAEKRAEILWEYVKRRKHRRQKPGRALESTDYTFDILANFGVYRDLQRHRILTQERQDFTTVHGFETPPEIEEVGFQFEYESLMNRAHEVYERIYADLPREAQYVVPFAFNVRWYMKMNLREAVHLCELRATPQGHPAYRRIAQEMWRQIQNVHPLLGECAQFMDWNTYRLGRLQSEIRTEYKRANL